MDSLASCNADQRSPRIAERDLRQFLKLALKPFGMYPEAQFDGALGGGTIGVRGSFSSVCTAITMGIVQRIPS
jgi:hypothetical protein